MMECLFDFSKNVILFTVFMNLWELLIPKGKYAKYINLVLSFILITVVINPIIEGLSHKKEMNFDLDFQKNVLMREAKLYNEKYYNLICEEFEENLKNEINKTNIINANRCKVGITVDESGIFNIEKIIIYTDKAYATDASERLADFLGFDKNKIFIEG